MKLQNLAVILLLTASVNLFAQDNQSPTPEKTTKSKLSLYLTGSTNFSSRSSVGGNIGAKYFIIPKLALRGGFSINTGGSGFRPPRMRDDGFIGSPPID